MTGQAMDKVQSVTINLSADGDVNPDTILFPDRELLLTRENASVAIGRASKVASKGFIASKDTAWFDNQVMSRNHAELAANLDEKKVNIRDMGSLHGTFINDDRLEKDVVVELKDGDNLRFGIPVLRGQDSFAPTCVKVGIIFGLCSAERATTPENAFKVPDGSVISDDEEDFASEDDDSPTSGLDQSCATGLPSETVLSSNIIDLTYTSTAKTDYPTVIDITSPPGSPRGDSDVVAMDDKIRTEIDIISVHSPSPDLEEDGRLQNGTVNVPDLSEDTFDASAYYGDEYHDGTTDYDNDSIHLSTECDEDDDEDMSEGDALHSDSDDRSHSDEDSEIDFPSEGLDSEFERELESELGWEAEYSSGDEPMEDELEEIDEWENNGMTTIEPIGQAVQSWSPELPGVRFAGKSTSELPESTIASYKNAALTTKNTTQSTEPVILQNYDAKPSSVSIEGLLNTTQSQNPDNILAVQATIPPLIISSPSVTRNVRFPSPSDAALAKSLAPCSTETTSSADTLGMKTGKFEFFAAREDNKSKAAQMQINVGSPMFCGQGPDDLQPSHGPFSIKKAMATPSQPVASVSETAQYSQWYERGASFLNTPPPLLAEFVSENISEAEDEAMTSAYTFQQHKRKQNINRSSKINQVPARTYVGISDIVDSVHTTSTECGKAKRKADEITEVLTPAEEKYELVLQSGRASSQFNSATPPSAIAVSLATPPSTVEPVITPNTSDTFAPDLPALRQLATRKELSGADRPIKRRRLRKIAERAGYIAFGGITVTAMVVGSLIYTAPTF